MRKHYIKHDNLRKSLEILYDDIENIPDSEIEKFFGELKHSSLIIAAEINGALVNFSTVENEGKAYGLLFTDMDEFRKLLSDEEHESHIFDFLVYQTFVKEGMIDGYILNAERSALF